MSFTNNRDGLFGVLRVTLMRFPTCILLTLTWALLLDSNSARKAQVSQSTSIITNDIMLWKAPKTIRENFPYFLSGFDEDGRPIWVWELGVWDIRSLMVNGGWGYRESFDKYIDQMWERLDESPRRYSQVQQQGGKKGKGKGKGKGGKGKGGKGKGKKGKGKKGRGKKCKGKKGKKGQKGKKGKKGQKGKKGRKGNKCQQYENEYILIVDLDGYDYKQATHSAARSKLIEIMEKGGAFAQYRKPKAKAVVMVNSNPYFQLVFPYIKKPMHAMAHVLELYGTDKTRWGYLLRDHYGIGENELPKWLTGISEQPFRVFG